MSKSKQSDDKQIWRKIDNKLEIIEIVSTKSLQSVGRPLYKQINRKYSLRKGARKDVKRYY